MDLLDQQGLWKKFTFASTPDVPEYKDFSIERLQISQDAMINSLQSQGYTIQYFGSSSYSLFYEDEKINGQVFFHPAVQELAVLNYVISQRRR